MKKYLTKENIAWGVLVLVVLFITIPAILSIDIQNEPPQPSIQYGIGDELIDGPFGFTITDAKRDGEKVTLHVRAKNHGSQAEALYGGSVRLVDVNGRIYEHALDTVSKLTVNPGMETEGKVTFEVPDDAYGLEAAVNYDAIQSSVDKAFGNKAEYKTIKLEL